MIILILSLIAVYILSTIKMYRWFRIAHSPKGRWSRLDADFGAVFFTFIPIINTVIAVINMFDSPYAKQYRKERKSINYNKLFNIKK